MESCYKTHTSSRPLSLHEELTSIFMLRIEKPILRSGQCHYVEPPKINLTTTKKIPSFPDRHLGNSPAFALSCKLITHSPFQSTKVLPTHLNPRMSVPAYHSPQQNPPSPNLNLQPYTQNHNHTPTQTKWGIYAFSIYFCVYAILHHLDTLHMCMVSVCNQPPTKFLELPKNTIPFRACHAPLNF